jgi:hypothetical protein
MIFSRPTSLSTRWRVEQQSTENFLNSNVAVPLFPILRRVSFRTFDHPVHILNIV